MYKSLNDSGKQSLDNIFLCALCFLLCKNRIAQEDAAAAESSYSDYSVQRTASDSERINAPRNLGIFR